MGQFANISATSPIKSVAIDHASSGDNELLAAKPGVKYRVISAMAIAAGDVLARFESNPGGTAKTGQMSLTTNSGFVIPHNPDGWFDTEYGQTLNLELSDNISLDGVLTYVEVNRNQPK